MIHRQGDLLFVKRNEMPKGLEKKKANVLAYGEVTGHSHRFEFDSIVTFAGEEKTSWIDTPEVVTIIHEEHAPITLEKGIWEVKRQREYSPQNNRRVLD